MVMRFGGLDLNLLVALNALLEERSVTKAADRLHTSQPAMSAALSKLRQHFGDELLIRDGREMVPTAQADFLMRPIAEVLSAIQHAMRAKPFFDPATAERVFRVMMSDYMSSITLPPLLALFRREAPSVQVFVVPSDPTIATQLERGDIDLAIVPDKYLIEGHPSELITEDTYVIVVDKENKAVGDTITLEQYLSMDHVVVNLSGERNASFEDWFLEHFNVSRKYVVSVPTFSMVPALIVGTSMIATMHSMLARHLVDNFNIRLVKAPEGFPLLRESLQWHKLRGHDLGLAWFRQRLIEVADEAAKKKVSP